MLEEGCAGIKGSQLGRFLYQDKPALLRSKYLFHKQSIHIPASAPFFLLFYLPMIPLPSWLPEHYQYFILFIYF